MKFLTDESIFSATVSVLRQYGHDVKDIRELGFSGIDNGEVIEVAKKESRILFTVDKHFGNILKFPVGSNPGVVLLRIKPLTIEKVHPILEDFLKIVKEKEIRNSLVVIDNIKIRIRRGKDT